MKEIKERRKKQIDKRINEIAEVYQKIAEELQYIKEWEDIEVKIARVMEITQRYQVPYEMLFHDYINYNKE